MVIHLKGGLKRRGWLDMRECFNKIEKILSGLNPPADQLKNTIILIIEDNKCDQELISKLIVKSGGKVIIANDGKTGMNIACETKPDLIILDYFIPGENGDKICRKLKGCEETKNIPVLFLTVNESPSDMITCLEAGARGYMMKPVNSKSIISEIRYTLQYPLL
jgi:two-component system phosphate regulon response regulator PhoB